MMEWWNDIRMLCARYLVASEQMERSGPIAAAVRSAGYLSEDNSAEDGSSVEHDMYDDELHPPSYSHPRDSGIELASNGYTVGFHPALALFHLLPFEDGKERGP